MQNAANTSRFLIDFSSEREFADSGIAVSRSKLLQHAVVSRLAYTANSSQVFSGLAQSLIRLAEHSFSLRDVTTLRDVSQILVNLPFAKAAQVGRYYQAIATSRIGQADKALSLLEAVADDAPLVYRARAIQTLGSIYHRNGHYDEALQLFHEASRVASPENGRDPLTTLLVRLELSCIKSDMGDHRGALADCESLSPLVQIVAQQNPLYFYFYHNELAVEFAEMGRLAEAEAASAIALASPFARAYPEWSATRDEIAAKRKSASPSIVAIHRAPQFKPAKQAESARQAKAFRVAVSGRLAVNNDFFQRSTIEFLAKRLMVLNAVSILDRMLICIGPRAPPIRT